MTALTEFVELDRRGRVAVITVNNLPNNVLSHGVRKDLKDGVVAASGDPAVSAMVSRVRAGRSSPAETPLSSSTAAGARAPRGPRPDRGVLEPRGRRHPGTALLGGFEVILGCHYRVSVRTARCGLPGVPMDLLPGAGGTQRLPRHSGSPPPSSSSRAGCPSPATTVRALRCEPTACRRRPALASHWRGACGPTPGAGVGGQDGSRVAGVGGRGRWKRPFDFPIPWSALGGRYICALRYPRHVARGVPRTQA